MKEMKMSNKKMILLGSLLMVVVGAHASTSSAQQCSKSIGYSISFPYGGVQISDKGTLKTIYALLNVASADNPEDITKYFISTGAAGKNDPKNYQRYYTACTTNGFSFTDRTTFFQNNLVAYKLTAADNQLAANWVANLAAKKSYSLPAPLGTTAPLESLMVAVFGAGYTNNYYGSYKPSETNNKNWIAQSVGNYLANGNKYDAYVGWVTGQGIHYTPSSTTYIWCDCNSSRYFGARPSDTSADTDYSGTGGIVAFYRLRMIETWGYARGLIPYWPGVYGPIYYRNTVKGKDDLNAATVTPISKYSDFYTTPQNDSLDFIKKTGMIAAGWDPTKIFNDSTKNFDAAVHVGAWNTTSVPVVDVKGFYDSNSTDYVPYSMMSNSLSTYEGLVTSNSNKLVLPYFFGTGTDDGFFPIHIISLAQPSSYTFTQQNGLAPYAHKFPVIAMTTTEQPSCVSYYDNYNTTGTVSATYDYWGQYLQRNSFMIGNTPDFYTCKNNNGPYNYAANIAPTW